MVKSGWGSRSSLARRCLKRVRAEKQRLETSGGYSWETGKGRLMRTALRRGQKGRGDPPLSLGTRRGLGEKEAERDQGLWQLGAEEQERDSQGLRDVNAGRADQWKGEES